jgi:hypothetical protein
VAPRAPLLLLLGIAACATAPPAPTGEGTSVVAIALFTRPDRDVHAGTPKTVYFVKLAAEGDLTAQPTLLMSDFEADGVLYLMNAAPGRYAAVACYGKGPSRHWTAYFPEDLIRKTDRNVPAGRAVLLGSYEMDLRPITTTGDTAQWHYLHTLFPNWQTRSEALRLFTKDDHAWGGPWIDLGDEADVEKRMRKRLGTAWAGRFP